MASEPVPLEPKIGSRSADKRIAAVHPVARATAKGVKPGRQTDPLNPYVLTINKLQKRPAGREPRTLAALKVIRDLDPTSAQAIWNYLRLTGSGFDMRAVKLNGDGQEEEERGPAQAYLDELMTRVGKEYGGGGDQFHGVLTLSLLTYGALAMEVAPTGDLADVEDWYAIDPSLLSFQRDDAGNLLLGYYPPEMPGKWQQLNTEQVFYDPLDPDVDDPYGRPPMLSAVGAVMAKAQMIADLRAVVHNQGYPRLDLEVNTEYLMAAAPTQLKEPGRQDELTAWMDDQVSAIVSNFEGLNVDDTFVHLDMVKVNPLSAGNAMDFEKIEGILSRSLNSALKMLPIMLGFNETSTESHGSVQWQIQVAGIEALRRRVKRSMERAANISLRLAGFNMRAKAQYEEIRTVDRLYEKQADLFEAKTLAFHVSQNWRTNDEAGNIVTGHDAFGEPKLMADSTSTVPGEGPQAPQGKDQGKTQQKQEPAWTMLQELSEAAVGRRGRANGLAASTHPRSYDDDALAKYAEEGGRIFVDLAAEVIANLRAEGEFRDVPKDIAEDVFGRAFSREMKRLIRDAMEEGILDADVDLAIAVDENAVDRIWTQNRYYVAKIKQELREAMRTGQFKAVSDVEAWFARNAWREELMGRFLAKQAYSHGYTMALSRGKFGQRFTWELGVVESKHCGTCMARAGGEFTHEELQSIGYPGSGSLECGGNCHCSLVPVDTGEG